MTPAIRIHPQNPKIFEFRGKPLALITATEHYGSVINRPFRFERYLADAAEKKITLTRLFTLFRELQSFCNPYSTAKPETPDFITPYRRVGPAKALDGEPQFDLDQPNPEYFDRLHRFLSLASDYGIIVEVTLLSNTYGDPVWMLNPLNPKNNVNQIETIHWSEYMTCRHPKLFERQVQHIQRIVRETNRYDNIIYEICNEPGGNVDEAGTPSVDEVNRWLIALAGVIRDTEKDLPNRHLVSGQEAFTYSPWEQSSTLSFRNFPIDIVNMHPLPNTTYDGKSYDQGTFMSKQLKIRAVRDFCLAAYKEPKPLNLDEDNVASQYKDPDGWTIHRKRAWITALSGAHYDMIDFSIINYSETGTEASQRHIRSWIKNLSEFIHSIDLVRARPAVHIIQRCPSHTLPAVMAVEGEDYAIYLADERELDDPDAGKPISGEIVIDLPAGEYQIACYSPVSGLYSPWIPLPGGPSTRIQIPTFCHDLLLNICRGKNNAS